MIDTRWRHTNGYIYQIDGFQWDCERDRWVYRIVRKESITAFTRSPLNFHGLNVHGKYRFQRVK
jgi:hypothetical protein